MTLKKSVPSGEAKENDSGGSEKNGIVRLVCPFCYANCEYKSGTNNIPPKCNNCGKLLIRESNEDGKEMKCLDCLLAMDTPDGIWCLKFKGFVDEAMAKKCEEFVNKKIVHDEECDKYEREDI